MNIASYRTKCSLVMNYIMTANWLFFLILVSFTGQTAAQQDVCFTVYVKVYNLHFCYK